ncbi:Uncharacterised protein [Vibrio cholerae]|nr:Uncharacterised protein [Vibrio cholerae]
MFQFACSAMISPRAAKSSALLPKRLLASDSSCQPLMSLGLSWV